MFFDFLFQIIFSSHFRSSYLNNLYVYNIN
nr:MAG TPA: hypothetical protein [Caudoviricetes sp.]